MSESRQKSPSTDQLYELAVRLVKEIIPPNYELLDSGVEAGLKMIGLRKVGWEGIRDGKMLQAWLGFDAFGRLSLIVWESQQNEYYTTDNIDFADPKNTEEVIKQFIKNAVDHMVLVA